MPRKKKKRQNSQLPLSAHTIFDIDKIKQDAMNEALRILEPRLKLVEEERERIRKEAYDKALEDAMRYLMVCGSKALNNKYRFGYIRLERYIDETMRLAQEGNIEELMVWLDKVGFKLTFDAGERKNNCNESN